MHIAITGANGFIGQQLCPFLINKGYQLTTLTRAPFADHRWQNIALGTNGLANCKPEHIKNCDVVIHLAAQAHNPEATTADYFRTNVEQTQQLLEATIGSTVKHLIFISSVKAVGEETFYTRFNANTIPKPEDSYGKSKLAAEQLVRKHCDTHQISYTILRLPLVLDAGAKGNLGAIHHLLKRGIPLPLLITHNRRDVVSLNNINTALIATLENQAPKGRVLYLSNGKPLSTADIVTQMAQASHRKAHLFALPLPFLKTLLKIAGKQAWYQRLTGNLEVDVRDTITALNWTPDNTTTLSKETT